MESIESVVPPQKLVQVLLGICIMAFAHMVGTVAKQLIIGRPNTNPNRNQTNRARQRYALIMRTLANLVYISIMVVAVFVSLKVVGIEATSIVALLGAAGLALGLAVQGILSDIAAAILMALMPTFTIGDIISIDKGMQGRVEDFSLTNTTILDLSNGSTVIVPNRKLLDTLVTNHTRNPYRLVVIDIPFKTKETNAKSLMQFVGSFLDARPEVMKDVFPTMVGVTSISESGATVQAKVAVKSDNFDAYELAIKTALFVAMQK